MMKIKEDLHQLIDATNDEQLLKSYYQLIQQLSGNSTGILWDKLTAEQKDELLLSYHESFEKENLISHEDVKKTHHKWLQE